MKLRKLELKKDKKANIEDIFFFIVTMLGLALFIMIIALVQQSEQYLLKVIEQWID